MANVLGTLFTDIANAIRSKTGNTEKMAPIDFPSEIAKIESESTDIEQVNDTLDEINGERIGETPYTVTFVGVGGIQLGQMVVLEGDDCPDPVASGVFEAPIKEGTKYYGWAFSGWSLTEDGETDDTALSDVRSDRTVYATFTEYEVFIKQGQCVGLFDSYEIYWGLNPDYVLKLWGNGTPLGFYPGSSAGETPPWYDYQEQITAVIISEGITGIGGNSFLNCIALTSVSFPTTANRFTIDIEAFYGCVGLMNITIPAGTLLISERAFSQCEALNSVIFEETNGWTAGDTAILASDLADPTIAATYLKSTFVSVDWEREV